MKNMKDIMKQAQKMQADMARVQEEVAAEKVEASAGGGAVKVVVSGALELLSLSIDPDAVDAEDVGMLEEMILVAVNDGFRQAQEMSARRMQAVAGPLAGGLPFGM